MKSLSKYFLPEILMNPINRDLILILAMGLMAAFTLITAFIVIFHQF